MMWIIEDTMPHVNLFTSGELKRIHMIEAYNDLTSAYGGIRNFVSILDGIFEGIYSLSEVICAGSIITDALEGYLINDDLWMKGRYIRINDCDVVLVCSPTFIYTGDELDTYEFDANNGIRYQFDSKKRRIKKDSQLGKADHLKGSKKSQNKNN